MDNWLVTKALRYPLRFIPALAVRLRMRRVARFLSYYLLRMRNVTEGIFARRLLIDTTVVLTEKL